MLTLNNCQVLDSELLASFLRKMNRHFLLSVFLLQCADLTCVKDQPLQLTSVIDPPLNGKIFRRIPITLLLALIIIAIYVARKELQNASVCACLCVCVCRLL